MLDDYTSIEQDRKNDSLSIILESINQMYNNGRDSDIIQQDIEFVSLKDIDEYMKKIEIDQDSPIKLLTINSTDIYSTEDNLTLMDSFQIYPMQYPFTQRIYFIEGAQFASILVPIEIEKDCVSIVIQPLEQSLPFVKDEYYDLINKRYSKGKTIEQLKKEIPFVKFPKQKK